MILAMIGCVALGFLAGLFSFKIKTRWCQQCGATLGCIECAKGGVPAQLARR